MASGSHEERRQAFRALGGDALFECTWRLLCTSRVWFKIRKNPLALTVGHDSGRVNSFLRQDAPINGSYQCGPILCKFFLSRVLLVVKACSVAAQEIDCMSESMQSDSRIDHKYKMVLVSIVSWRGHMHESQGG